MARTVRHDVAAQLRERIVAGIHIGRMRGGQRLPSVRSLAEQFGVNERVALAALHELADEGFVEVRLRSGAYLAPHHPVSGPALPNLGAWLLTTLLQARSRGLAPHSVADFVKRGVETRRVRAACIECNADQLHSLCSELANDYGFVTDSVPLDDIGASEALLSLRRADVLVTTAYHADRVRRVAKALGKPWIAVTLEVDVMRGVAMRLEQGAVYFVASDPRFERKLRRMLAAFGPTTNLRVLLVGRDDLDAIPADGPTFLMTSTRDHCRKRYGRGGGPGRPIHPSRQLSDASARELLAFLIDANMRALSAAPALLPSTRLG